MANFDLCFDKTLHLEGGYILHNVSGDSGGMTYAGIARNKWPDWLGWAWIDAGEICDELKSHVKEFYLDNFWNRIRGDQIMFQEVAFQIYDFAVNAGVKTSVKIVQEIVGATPDGILGPNTIKKLSAYVVDERTERLFVAEFSLRKVFRYKDICMRNKSQLKFLCGWINRVQKGVGDGAH